MYKAWYSYAKAHKVCAYVYAFFHAHGWEMYYVVGSVTFNLCAFKCESYLRLCFSAPFVL